VRERRSVLAIGIEPDERLDGRIVRRREQLEALGHIDDVVAVDLLDHHRIPRGGVLIRSGENLLAELCQLELGRADLPALFVWSDALAGEGACDHCRAS
jgi:hypothetical protein